MWFKKLKKKKYSYFFWQNLYFSETSILSVEKRLKRKKSDVFRVFFLKYKKSYFAKILCKSWLVSSFPFFWSFFIFSKMTSKFDFKNWRKKSLYFHDKTDIFSQTSILSFEKWKKVMFFYFFWKHEKSCYAQILCKSWLISFVSFFFLLCFSFF